METLTILNREVFLELPEWWSPKFEEKHPRKGSLDFFGPIRSAGYIFFRVGGQNGYQLQVTSGTIPIFIREGSLEGTLTALPKGVALDVYPSSVVIFYAPPQTQVVVVVRHSAKEIR